jgi:hypothetical protein
MDSMLVSAARSRIVALAQENLRIAVHAVLSEIFDEAVLAAPKLIVELGVSKEALANKALVAAAELNGARVVGCDIGDFSDACSYPRWSFFREDARDFGRECKAFIGAAGIAPNVDVLLIDCDELYKTTREIWRAWAPNLSPACTVMFRCTNLAKTLHYEDGTFTTLGWDNGRGVIRAMEAELGISFDETKPFEGILNGWQVKHIPWGAGLTVLRRTA